MEKPRQHGGSRPGAGRPVKVAARHTVAIRVPDDIKEILDCQPNRSAFIIEAIRAFVK